MPMNRTISSGITALTRLAAMAVVVLGLLTGQVALGQGQPTLKLFPGDDLARAIKDAAPGTVLDLAGGNYGVLALKRAGGAEGAPITLRSADPADPALLSGMDLRNASHLVLDGLVFDYTYQPGEKGYHNAFYVVGCRDLTIRNSLFDGDVTDPETPGEVVYPTGHGVVIRGSSLITFENNEMRDFYRALAISSTQDMVVRGNNIHALRMDGITFAEVQRVLVEANHIHDFKIAVDSGDHADMIQFWTTGTDSPSTDIVIRDNVLNSGLGWNTQTIFMRNEEVDTGRAGPEMFYRRITIENNVIVNAHLHGISVGETDGLVIANNSLVRNAPSAGMEHNPRLWIPRIGVTRTSRNVEIMRNVVSTVDGYEDQPSWTLKDNFTVQDKTPTSPGYYDQVFVAARSGDPRNLASFRALPGGPLDGRDVGSSLLRATTAPIAAGRESAADSTTTPAIRVTVDDKIANRFNFDAGTSAGLEGLKADDTGFQWNFGDGQTAAGPRVNHRFDKPGLYRVVLTLRLVDGTDMTAISNLRVPRAEILVFSSQTGTVTSYAEPRNPVSSALGRGPADLGKGEMATIIDRNLIGPFFDAISFEIGLRLTSNGSFRDAGELLRVHQTLVVAITGRGMVDVQFETATDKLRLSGGPVRIYSGNWVDLILRYSAGTGLFQIVSDGKVLAEGRTSGPVGPMKHWGLSLGNPFNNAYSFKGKLDRLVLKVGAYDFTETE
jgi:hypothetical protein